jgi:AraC-like DNA-binding protein
VLAALALVLAVGLLVAPANRSANRWLAVFLAVLVGLGLDYAIDVSRLDSEMRWLRYAPISITMGLGPLVWAYVYRLTLGRSPPWTSLHLLPAALEFAYRAAFYVLPDHVRAALIDGRVRTIVAELFVFALPLSLAVYALASIRLIDHYSRRLSEQRSDVDQFAVTWLRGVMVVLLVTIAFFAALRAIAMTGRIVDVFDVYPFYGWLLLVGLYLGIEARRYLDRPFPALPDDPQHAAALLDNIRPAPAMPAKDWVGLATEWRRTTWNAGWYREPGLTLASLSRRLGVNTAYLSRGINEGLGQNFSEMVNGMRAEAVAERLDSQDGAVDLLDLAFEMGFGSKSSFNRAFLTLYGVSPSAYRDRARTRS